MFFQPCKNVKTKLSPRLPQNRQQAIWTMGGGLLTLAWEICVTFTILEINSNNKGNCVRRESRYRGAPGAFHSTVL